MTLYICVDIIHFLPDLQTGVMLMIADWRYIIVLLYSVIRCSVVIIFRELY